MGAPVAVAAGAVIASAMLMNPSSRTAAPHPSARARPDTTMAAARPRPIVYIQAGHEMPGEPGYLAQTGATGGPFGSEVAFNSRLAPLLAARLRRAGVDVRLTPAKVTPWGAGGAVFISLHFDAVGGSAGIGYAVDQPGRGENYYHGQGSGTASPVPYRDSAPHRRATRVSVAVQQHSLELARDLAAVFGRIHTPANGAYARFRGVEPGARGNVRMQFFYGYYRVNTGARVLIECGGADRDRTFLGHVGLIAGTIGSGIVGYLRQTRQLP
jgi:N-acetylmuramoyl-L-alanine amidase